jgi:monofunctional glycosyltransferase
VQRWVSYNHLSPLLTRAVLIAEDDAFWKHEGVDFEQLQESLQLDWRRGRLVRGASTITQQLAKNLYLSSSRNPLRKLKEAVIAYRLEWSLDKSRILALYLNVAEFGPNLWGVEAASERYFGKSAHHLSLDQAALLVATLPHPLTSNPAYRPGRTRWRQQLILLKLGGAPVLVPLEEPEEPVPAQPGPPPDTGSGSSTGPPDRIPPEKDSAAEPAITSDTAAVPPIKAPARKA